MLSGASTSTSAPSRGAPNEKEIKSCVDLTATVLASSAILSRSSWMDSPTSLTSAGAASARSVVWSTAFSAVCVSSLEDISSLRRFTAASRSALPRAIAWRISPSGTTSVFNCSSATLRASASSCARSLARSACSACARLRSAAARFFTLAWYLATFRSHATACLDARTPNASTAASNAAGMSANSGLKCSANAQTSTTTVIVSNETAMARLLRTAA